MALSYMCIAKRLQECPWALKIWNMSAIYARTRSCETLICIAGETENLPTLLCKYEHYCKYYTIPFLMMFLERVQPTAEMKKVVDWRQCIFFWKICVERT